MCMLLILPFCKCVLNMLNFFYRDSFQSVPAHHTSFTANYSVNGHAGPGCGGPGSSSSSASSNGRNGNSNAEYHAHYHPTQAPPPAHHHHHSGRNDVLRGQEMNHQHVIREAHSIKSTSAWGPSTLPPHSYRQEITYVDFYVFSPYFLIL